MTNSRFNVSHSALTGGEPPRLPNSASPISFLFRGGFLHDHRDFRHGNTRARDAVNTVLQVFAPIHSLDYDDILSNRFVRLSLSWIFVAAPVPPASVKW